MSSEPVDSSSAQPASPPQATLESAKREAAEMLSLFIQRSPIYAYIKEVSGTESRVLHVSENYQQMLGIPATEMVGKTMEELFPVELAATMTADDLAVVQGGEVLQVEEELAGRTYTSLKFPIVLGERRTLLAGYSIDITEQRTAEADRRELLIRSARAERTAALGTLAAGMSHQINNPLTYVIAGIAFAREQLQAARNPGHSAWLAGGDARQAEVDEALREAEEGANRVKVLVADLSAFALGQHSADASCDLPSAFERAAKVAAHALTGGTTLTVEFPDHPSVMGSQAELMQLFAGLLVNAYQAKGAGPNRVRVTAEFRGPKALVSISDTGTGIPAEDLPKVFLPFFTTRAIGQGKGLGLPVALGIAQGLGGSVELVSTLGQGTTVTVTLPTAGGG